MITERERTFSEPDVDSQIDFFKERFGVEKIIGFIGGSTNDNPDILIELREAMEVVKSEYGPFGVLSGGTRGGISEAVIKIGKSLLLPTIGVYPERKEENSLQDELDLAIPVSSQVRGVTWGCESAVLTGIPDLFVLVGGEYGTLVEVSMIMKRNTNRFRKGETVIPIISLKETGGVADFIFCFEQHFPVPEGCLYQVRSSQEASRIIIQNFRRQEKCQ